MLAITAQLILVFSFFSTILLKADMAGEVLTHDRVGVLMVVVNLPMAMFFVWDVRLDVVEHFAAVDFAQDNVMMVDVMMVDNGMMDDVMMVDNGMMDDEDTTDVSDDSGKISNPLDGIEQE